MKNMHHRLLRPPRRTVVLRMTMGAYLVVVVGAALPLTALNAMKVRVRDLRRPPQAYGSRMTLLQL